MGNETEPEHLRVHSEDEADRLKTATISYQQPPASSFRADAISATVEFDIDLLCKQSRTSAEFSAMGHLILKPDSPQSINWFTDNARKICHLISMLADEQIKPYAVTMLVDPLRPPSSYLYRTAKSNRKADDSSLLLFYLGHLQGEFVVIMNKWLSVDEVMRDSINLMMNVLSQPELADRLRFLLTVQSLEVFSRATSDGQYMKRKEYNPIHEQIVKAIPPSVSDSQRSSLKSRIYYGIEHSLRKRVTELIESLCPETKDIVCKDVDNFVAGIIATRNYLTHYTTELRQEALSGADMHWATEKMLILLRILYFRFLGVPEATTVIRMQNHHRFNMRIFNAKKARECNPAAPKSEDRDTD